MPKTTITKEEFLERAREIIEPNPLDRLADPARKAIESGNYIHDVHVHTFDKRAINESYFLIKLIGINGKSKSKNKFALLNPMLKTSNLKGLEPIDDPQPYGELISEEDYAVLEMLKHLDVEDIEEFYEKYENGEIPNWAEIESVLNDSMEEFNSFSKTFKIASVWEFLKFILGRFYGDTDQEDMLRFYLADYGLTNLANFEDKTLVCSVLMMDFYKEFGGKVTTDNLWKQVNHLNGMANKYPVIPFLALDPRRVDNDEFQENLYELFLKAFDHRNGGRFFGVKLYPSLGYSPSDHRLAPFYKICEEFGIPVVTHCGGEMVSTFDKVVNVYENFDSTKTVKVQGNKRKERVFYLNDPKRFEPVLEKYKNLKINLAHFGSNEAWIANPENLEYPKRVTTIMDMMKNYPGVYTDFSFCVADKKTYDKLKSIVKENPLVLERLMYGTDYWVVLFNKGKRFIQNLNNFVTNVFDNEDLMEKMLTKNPDKYLFGQITEDENQ